MSTPKKKAYDAARYLANKEVVKERERVRRISMSEEEKQWVRERTVLHRMRNPYRYQEYEKKRAKSPTRAYQKRDPRLRLLNSAKLRAKKYGLPFWLSKEDIIIPERCPILGIELSFGKGMPMAYSPSLDQLIPGRGYVKGNVWVISHRANTLKSNATSAELLCVAKAVRMIEEKVIENG